MTVGELGQRMSSHEFTEWLAYYDLEPFGEERADLRQAMTTSGVHNLLQAKTKHPRWTKPDDFMPFKDKPDPVVEPGSPEDLKGKLLQFASAGRKATG
jgi:hypothetical protein